MGLVSALLVGCGDGGTTGSGGAGAAGGSGGAGATGGTGGTGGSGGTGAGPCNGTVVEVVGYAEPAVPVAGTTVLVHDASGAFVSKLTSDAEGKVCADIPADGSVGAVADSINGPELTFVVAPPPGALVRLRVSTETKSVKETTYVTQLVFNPGVGTKIVMLGNCSDIFEQPLAANQFSVIAQLGGCTNDPDDYSIYLKNDAGQIVAWDFIVDAPKKPGEIQDLGMRTVYGTELNQVAFSFSDIPAGFSMPQGSVRGQGNRNAFSFGAPLGGGTGMVNAPAVTGLPLRFTVSASGEAIGEFDTVYRYLAVERLSPTWITNLDASGSAIAPANEVTSTHDDPARPQTSWKWQSGAVGDSTRLYLQLSDGDAKRWSVAAMLPPDRTSFTMPAIPDELAKYRPDTKYVTLEVLEHDDWDSVADYAEAVGVQAPATVHAHTTFMRNYFPNGVP